jgi:hypothetical protein
MPRGNGKSLSPQLARPGDPLVRPNGDVIQPFQDPVRVDDTIKPHEFKPLTRRSIKDLPATGSIMSGIAVVFTYTLLGLSNREIAEMLNITVQEVEQIQAHSAYAVTFEAVLAEFINSNSDMIQSRIAAYSHMALSTVAHIAQEGERETNRLKASDSLLDRALESKRGQSDKGALRIIISEGEHEVRIESIV